MGAVCNTVSNNDQYEANLVSLHDERYTYVHKQQVKL